jgi:predicted RNase H-like nuclease (RuvC/YqgF family)
MAKEIEHLQRDNNALRSNEERLRQEMLNLEKQRDNYREKYQETKSKNNILNSKLAEVNFF